MLRQKCLHFIGVTVGVVHALDSDSGDNAHVSYSILSQWSRNQFALHSTTGILTVIGSLDREQVRVSNVFQYPTIENGFRDYSVWLCPSVGFSAAFPSAGDFGRVFWSTLVTCCIS